jgi:hypothetical protein
MLSLARKKSKIRHTTKFAKSIKLLIQVNFYIYKIYLCLIMKEARIRGYMLLDTLSSTFLELTSTDE